MQNFTDIGETDGVPVYSNELANWDFEVFSLVIRSRLTLQKLNWTELEFTSWSSRNGLESEQSHWNTRVQN